jgi:hypothetical protein
MLRHIAVLTLLSALCITIESATPAWAESLPYTIIDTGQQICYGNRSRMACTAPNRSFFGDFYGQDAQYRGVQPRYKDNHDGTINDLNTGLMWVKARGGKMYWDDAVSGAASSRVGGYTDWRAPTIKELYSLIDFRGNEQRSASTTTPYLDTRYFDFKFGDTSAGERFIDCQDWSATKYVATTMGNNPTAFGVNFADGRIKGYGIRHNTRDRRYMRYVRGNPAYGHNNFDGNGGGTVTDRATGLVWQQADSGQTHNWRDALAYCENLSLAGHNDWRLPNAKELQSIVDYSRSPTTTGSAAIDPIFSVTNRESYYWTGTTHLSGPTAGEGAAYVAFGRAMGYFAPPRSNQQKRFIDVHGAGAQRSDPKSGNPAKYPQGFGPQGDDRRINNYVRCVRGGQVETYTPTFSDRKNPPWAGRGTDQMGSDQGAGMGQGQRPGIQQGFGQDQGQQGQSGQQRRPGMGMGPPPEATQACEGKSENAQCAFEAPHGTIAGTCRTMRDGVACVPAGHGPGGGEMRRE